MTEHSQLYAVLSQQLSVYFTKNSNAILPYLKVYEAALIDEVWK